ncbi:hypothetical protein HZS_4409 [Henneguya salminicola]|nr:hypothetical protein HZS_4409 [Henneguya salminicola]
MYIRMGMITETGIPKTVAARNICALCGLIIVDYDADEEEISVNCIPGLDLSYLTTREKVIQLNCGHRYQSTEGCHY